jgi:hypothetical protein
MFHYYICHSRRPSFNPLGLQEGDLESGFADAQADIWNSNRFRSTLAALCILSLIIRLPSSLVRHGHLLGSFQLIVTSLVLNKGEGLYSLPGFTFRYLSSLLMYACASQAGPFLPSEAAARGAGSGVVGAFFSACAIPMFLSGPLLAHLIPFVGPKLLIIVGTAACGVLSIMFSFVDCLEGRMFIGSSSFGVLSLEFSDF